jgi:hypothetical protein
MSEAREQNTVGIEPVHWIIWFGLLVSVFILYPVSLSSSWISGSDVHALFELWAAFVALTAGLVIMIHYFATGSWMFLIISLGFVLQGGEDLVHAMFSFTRIWGAEQQEITKFVPGTYATGRLILVACIIFAWFLREKFSDEAQRSKLSLMVFISGIAFSTISTILIIKFPFTLPSFIIPGHIISRPLDFIITLIFIPAIALYIKAFGTGKYHTPFVFSIICSLIYGISAQIYMDHSQRLYDAQFDMAHITKIISYVFPILGISLGTFNMYKTEAEHAKALALSMQKEKEFAAASTAAAETEKKRAAELAAAMRQLHAGRQQLSEANQQMAANEQELRAANEQLTAKERELRAAQQELMGKVHDLERFNKIMVGRELEMIKLKREINSCLENHGEAPKYQT